MSRDRRVDAVGVRLQQYACTRAQALELLLRRLREPESAHQAVALEEAGSADRRELAGAVSAQHIHLKAPILSVHEPYGEHGIVRIGCENARDTLGIALNGHRSIEAADHQGAVELRQ